MTKRVRLKDNEATALGFELRKSKGHGNPKYTLQPHQLKKLSEIKRNTFKLSPNIASKLGLKISNNNYYYLDKKTLKAYYDLDINGIKRLFFDIETSPMIVYSWRTGWKLNIGTENIIQDWKIICISYKWEGEDKVHTLSWDKNQCDKQLLLDFIKIANEADEIIAHNGDRFDIKKIRTRCIYHRIPMFPKYRSLDTLKKAKSGFVFNSNKLDYIAKFLGVGAKLEHEGFNMWVKCMQNDKEALKEMIKYCEQDIVVLEDVFLVLQNYIKNNTHTGTHNAKLKCSCPNCSSEDISLLKNNFTALGTIKRQLECNTCKYVYETSNSAWRQYLDFKQNEMLSNKD